MILVAAVLPYLTVAIAKWRPSYNNQAPRAGLERLTPWQQRAYWAHLNMFEAFPAFAAAVIIAHLAHAPQPVIDKLALAFVALRIIYLLLYLQNWATARSVVWTAGFACVVGLFLIAP
jgi:uncharacterized MAPEG superfamily protein